MAGCSRSGERVPDFSERPFLPPLPVLTQPPRKPPAVEDEAFNQAAALIPVYSTARAALTSTAPAAVMPPARRSGVAPSHCPPGYRLHSREFSRRSGGGAQLHIADLSLPCGERGLCLALDHGAHVLQKPD